MKLSNTLEIAAARNIVWAALNDPAILKQSIEGCKSLVQREHGAFDGIVEAKIGPVRASFQGVVTISDVDAPSRYVLSGEGKGGVAGFAKGKATVSLTEISEQRTRLDYSAEAAVGGKIAQLGARLIESTAKDYADKFFVRFKALLEVTENVEIVSMSESVPTQVAAHKGTPAWIWAGGVIAILAASIWYFLVIR
jgi:uncharacterized protein